MGDTCENCGKPLGSTDVLCYTCSEELDDEEQQSLEVQASIFDGVEDV